MASLPLPGRDVLAIAGRPFPAVASRRGAADQATATDGPWLRRVHRLRDMARAVGELTRGGIIHLWEPGTKQLLHSLDGRDGLVSALCGVRVGGQLLLAAAARSGLTLWDSDTGEPGGAAMGCRYPTPQKAEASGLKIKIR
jgi:hypothetical protein